MWTDVTDFKNANRGMLYGIYKYVRRNETPSLIPFLVFGSPASIIEFFGT